jgi:hypothetical protein
MAARLRKSSLNALMHSACLFQTVSQGYVGAVEELTTSIAGIDFSSDDKSKSNRRMECMLCPLVVAPV